MVLEAIAKLCMKCVMIKRDDRNQRLTDTHLLERMKAFSVNGSRSLHAKRRSDQWALGIVL